MSVPLALGYSPEKILGSRQFFQPHIRTSPTKKALACVLVAHSRVFRREALIKCVLTTVPRAQGGIQRGGGNCLTPDRRPPHTRLMNTQSGSQKANNSHIDTGVVAHWPQTAQRKTHPSGNIQAPITHLSALPSGRTDVRIILHGDFAPMSCLPLESLDKAAMDRSEVAARRSWDRTIRCTSKSRS